jgi:diguanylate cyclase (GGDEF)-like protein/putative nucleotidyltransferase with HDIG domain
MLKNESKRIEIEKLHWETEKLHAEEIYELHLRTIEGLALAIDAKDHTTHEHLLRVRCYCMEIGKEMGFTGPELDALRAASLLHDIGKLAVPDHIINKPGRLRQEEFEKMKIHPIIGAEILERISFPYAVAPIVRAHHEKWNGEGYPHGLKGDDIPLGARILSAVDALDALASDRQYRKALPLDEAMCVVASQSGTSFDPEVIAVLQRRYKELEALAVREMEEARDAALSIGANIKQGNKPASGLEPEGSYQGPYSDYLNQIASARNEAHALFELSLDLGYSLSMVETLSLVSMRLAKLVPFDTILFYVRNEEILIPEFVSGENDWLLSQRAIPVGTGICGWVAQNIKPIVNGNPAVEPWFAEAPRNSHHPHSALAVPLEGIAGLEGVLVLYHSDEDAYTAEHLRVLQVVSTRVAMFVENALKYRVAETSATIDYLTGLANVRSLSAYMEQEISRCRRHKSGFAVLVCDLNGFKEVNDLYGHPVGDRVLKRFAQLMRDACREYDYTARMGGDEFVIIAPDMAPAFVADRAALLSNLARQAGYEAFEKDTLSLSLGTAFYPQDGTDPQQLLAEADKRMYSAKRHFYSASNTPKFRDINHSPADHVN